MAKLLDSLWKAGAEQQVAALVDRAAVHALDYTGFAEPLGELLGSLREAGAEQQVAALVDRAAAHALDHPEDAAGLLYRLREAGAEEQVRALTYQLTDQLPGAGMFGLFLEQGDRRDRFRFGREADGSPAKPWDWEDLD